MTSPDTQTSIREAAAEPDRILLADTARTIWHECFARILTQEQIEYMLERFQSAQAIGEQIRQGYRYYFILHQGQTAGYFGIQPQADGQLFLSKLYLAAPYRGRGLGSAAFHFMEELCRRQGWRSIYLTVNRHNTHAIQVYRHRGFRQVEERVTPIGNGFVMDDYIFMRDIAPDC